MGNHEGANARLRASDASRPDKASTFFNFLSSHAFTLRNWPVSWRLFAVFMLTLAMGLVFGGLRVSAAVDSAAQFSRVSQLASLGQQVTGLMQALEAERDETCRSLPVRNPGPLQRWYDATDAAATKVQALASGIGGSFPADIKGESGRRALRDLRPRAAARCGPDQHVRAVRDL
jgi:hypothetical protein